MSKRVGLAQYLVDMCSSTNLEVLAYKILLQDVTLQRSRGGNGGNGSNRGRDS